MKFKEEIKILKKHENSSLTRLKEIISDLEKGSDIEGAALVDKDDAIIASVLPQSSDYESEIPNILALLSKDDISVIIEESKGIFTQQVLNYNGCKILAKKIRDELTLLVMLHKRGYLSLAMIDIENTIRRIEEILLGSGYHKSFNC